MQIGKWDSFLDGEIAVLGEAGVVELPWDQGHYDGPKLWLSGLLFE